ncbi:Asp-tRNA(Asn)/Glu-tRNA(Gln) amidotransferase subunit GatC [Derxia gummosa]|uniref:Aspartyl/glutamyl-tRNA(Asn/Gln) amidotransferase subunit C n=1 Tax=Derxia gummosa DSM 723 TaxID=1121388 RepID=A0A8B6X220_9BURK|nr:Asp-tRNA(Asn)/Glu-tRNA(Gln) amidotransferase subunit GatC [Derxia gummosa]
MSLTLSDVERIAHLARIQITPADAERMLGELNGIFGLIEQMQAIDTTGIEPMAHPLGGAQRLRADEHQTLIPRDDTMKNAPARQDGLFLVPKVIE